MYNLNMTAVSHHLPPSPTRFALLIGLNFHHQVSLSPFTSLPNPLVQENQEIEQLIHFIKSCTRKTNLLQIHAHIIKSSLIQHHGISNHFLSRIALSPFRETVYAHQLFEEMLKRTVSHYNTMIRAYSMTTSPQEGFFLYRDMQRQGFRGDPLSFSLALKSCVGISSFINGAQIHARIFRYGYLTDSLLLTTLMEFYSCCKQHNEACKVFDEIPLRDVVSWNVLISSCIRNNRKRDALSLYEIMQSETYQCKPDDVTCLHLLQACSHLNALEFGKRIHCYIKDHGYDQAINLCNTLIAMYSKCGSLDKAYEVFNGMRDKNVVSWSAMIMGLAMNGKGREAINAFSDMLDLGLWPDNQTFTGVLSACSHTGLVKEGMMFFDRMTKEFGMSPNVHHYGCIVDLLGRAGMLDRAYEVIMSMEVKADSTIWRTLLGSCRIHSHVDLAERVIDHLIELKAQEAGDYVLLLNIYSSAGNWEKVKELRTFMKEKDIQTSPGCSTIELKGQVHEFLVDDISHPSKDKVYEMLEEINKQLKIAGYVVEIKSELHNYPCEQEKGYGLSYHSEKLAIAFGVLMTPPRTSIRVAKNLRTCVDCHNFAKFVSSVYDREVVVRDRSRFHHFRDGRCSCGDYW